MSVKEVTRTIEIAGTPDKCYKKICDFESYPQWQSAVQSTKVIKKDKDGRPKTVEFKISVMGKEIRYVLSYKYEDKTRSLSWTYVEGDVRDV
jgi:ribosome-associated toxin RatA of RatAB toxin-antitoxin module